MVEQKSNNLFTNILDFLSKNRTLFSIIFFTIYAICACIGVIHHEPWRDEGNPWLVARDLNLFEIFIQTGSEGHPFLWYFILKPLTLLPYYFINIVNVIFVILAVYIIIFKIKIPFYYILIWVFLTPIFYEYPVIARNYGISLLLCALILYFYEKRFDKPILYTVLLGFFINTTVIAAILGAVFLLYFQYELVLNKKNDDRYSKNKLYSILMIGLFFLFLILTQILFMFIARGSGKIPILKDAPLYICPIISFIPSFILSMIYLCLLKYNDKLQIPKMNNIIKIFTLLLLGYCLFSFSNQASVLRIPVPIIILILLYKNKFSSFIVSLMYFGIICISMFYGKITNRHIGIFLFFIFIYMIYEVYKDNKKLITIVSLIILIHIVSVYGIRFMNNLYSDIKYDYSGSYKAANFIKESGFNNKDKYLIIPVHYSITGSIAPYFDEKIFYNADTKEYISFTEWQQSWHISPNSIHNNYDKEAIFVGYEIKNFGGKNFELITNFSVNMTDDSIYFYKLVE